MYLKHQINESDSKEISKKIEIDDQEEICSTLKRKIEENDCEEISKKLRFSKEFNVANFRTKIRGNDFVTGCILQILS